MSVFYYESQLRNKNSTVRVYAEPGFGDPNIAYIDGELVVTGKQTERELILVTMISEDFTMGISNSYSEGNDDIISSTAKSIAEAFKANARFLGGAADNIRDLAGDDNIVSKGLDVISSKSQYHLLTYNDRVSMFNGTSISFDYPIKGFIYNNSQPITAGSSTTISVKQAVKRLVERCVGDLVDFAETGDDKSLSDLNGYFAFQKPPNGYVARMNNLSNKKQPFPPGTFTLEIGDLYVVKGLIVESLVVTMSKQKVKDRDGATSGPLYAEITMSLKPAIEYLKPHIKDFLGVNV